MNLRGAAWRLLSIQRSELVFVIPLYLLYFLSGSCYAVGQIYSETLFLKAYGAAGFSGFFIQSGIAMIAGGVLYNYTLLRASLHRGYLFLIAAATAFIAGCYLLIDAAPDRLPFYLYLGNFLSSFFLDLHFFNYAYQYLTIRNSKRIIPFLIGGGKLGGILSSMAIFTALAGRIEHIGPLLWAGNAALLALPLVFLQIKRVPRYQTAQGGGDAQAGGPFLGTLARRLRSSYSSPIFLYSMIAVFIMAVLNQVSEYYSADVINRTFSSRGELASFLSVYTFTADIVTLIVTTTLTARIIRGAGIPKSNAVYPASLLSLLLLFIAAPGLATAILLRFNKKNMAPIIRSPVFNIIMASSPRDRMAEVKSFITGIVNPLGMVTGGIAIYLIDRYLAGPPGLALALLLCALYLMMTLLQNRAYVGSLRDTLSRGLPRYDVAGLDRGDLLQLATSPGERIQGSGIIQEIFIDSPSLELLESLRGSYARLAPATREAVLRYLKTTRYAGEREILASALRDRSPLVRSLAYTLLQGYPLSERREMLEGRVIDPPLSMEPLAVSILLGGKHDASALEEALGGTVKGILEGTMPLAEFIVLSGVLTFESVRRYALQIALETWHPMMLRYLLQHLEVLEDDERISLMSAYTAADRDLLLPFIVASPKISAREILMLLDNRQGISDREMDRMFRYTRNEQVVQHILAALFTEIDFERKANYLEYLMAVSSRPVKAMHRYLRHEIAQTETVRTLRRQLDCGSGADPAVPEPVRAYVAIALADAAEMHRFLALKSLSVLAGINIDEIYEATVLLKDADMGDYLLEFLESSGGSYRRVADLFGETASQGAASPAGVVDGPARDPLVEGIGHLEWFVPTAAVYSGLTRFLAPRESRWDDATGLAENEKERNAMLNQIQKIVLLKQSPLFGGMRITELIRLSAIAGEREVESDTVMIREGEAGDELFIVIEGEVEVFTATRTVSVLGPGSCIGELSVIDTEPRSSSVRTLKRCRLLSIRRRDFIIAVREEPAIAINVMKILADRLRFHIARSGTARDA